MNTSTELINIEVTKKSLENKIIKTYKGKRLIDILFAIVGIILLIPITLFIVILNIKNREKQKIFFTQNRIGKDGKPIKIYKYNSMVKNAEEVLDKLMKENEEIRKEYLENKKLRDDPRITKTGKTIRKLSLDEFPQFINVLKGEMSVVGPRPYLFREKEDMGEYYAEIIKVKPGITGPWQTNGRNDVSFEHRLEMDMFYVFNRSLKLDIKIIFKTFYAVIRRHGVV